jgi:hypothetical protein
VKIDNPILGTPNGNGSALTDITAGQVGLGNVTNAAQTLASVVPNTLPNAGYILVGNASNSAYAPVQVSADLSLASTGAMTISPNTVSNAARTVLDDASVSAMVDTLGGAAAGGTGGLVRMNGAAIALANATGLPVAGGGTNSTTVLGGQQTFNPFTLNTQSVSYTLQLADVAKVVLMNNANANTLTIPNNNTVAFPNGTSIMCGQMGAGVTTTSAADNGVSYSPRGGATKSAGQNAIWFLLKVGTDAWWGDGDITT